jgi:hypothetical protein
MNFYLGHFLFSLSLCYLYVIYPRGRSARKKTQKKVFPSLPSLCESSPDHFLHCEKYILQTVNMHFIHCLFGYIVCTCRYVDLNILPGAVSSGDPV